MTTNQAESPRPALASLVFVNRTLDLRREVLMHEGEELRLRPRTFGVLSHLLRNAGRVVTKQELMDVVWADAEVTEDSLVQCLIEIRRALGPAHDVIKTVRGRGYLVDCEVLPVHAGATDLPEEGPLRVPPADALLGIQVPSTPKFTRGLPRQPSLLSAPRSSS
jgi:DNA-binding winged helix-turn-helix (wHTH) protein